MQLDPQLAGIYNSSQYGFDLGNTPASSLLNFSFTVHLDSFATGDANAFIPDNESDYFSVLFDTPGVERIDFTSNGTSSTGRILAYGGTQEIGTFDYGTNIDVTIELNLPDNSWSVDMTQNDISVASIAAGNTFFEEFGANTFSGQIEQIRLVLQDGAEGDGDAIAIIDNLLIVPEPAFGGLLIALAVFSRTCCARRRPTRP